MPALSSRRPHRLAAIVLAALSLPATAIGQSPLLNHRAPEFVRTSLDHHPIDLRAYRGKVVLLNFWATWCAPCQLEMPRFVTWQNKYGPANLQIIGISMDDDPALARAAYRKLQLNYPVAMGDARLGELYGGILGLPVTILIDAQGRIRARYDSETDLNAIESTLKSILPFRSTRPTAASPP